MKRSGCSIRLTIIKRLLIVLLSLSLWACATSRPVSTVIAENPSPCPGWIRKPPDNQMGMHYFVGFSGIFRFEKDARIDAARYCLNALAKHCRVQLNLFHQYIKEYHGKSSRLFDPDVHYYSRDEYVVEAFVQGMEEKEWCIQQLLMEDKKGRPYKAWKAYLLAAVPEDEIKQIREYKPQVTIASPRLHYQFNEDNIILFWDVLPPDIDSVGIYQGVEGNRWTEIHRIRNQHQNNYIISSKTKHRRYKIIIDDGFGHQIESNDVLISRCTEPKGVFYLVSAPPKHPSECFLKTTEFFEDTLIEHFDQLKIHWQKQDASQAQTVYHFNIYPETRDDRYRVNIENVKTGKILYRGRYLYGGNDQSGACRFGIGLVDKKGIRDMISRIIPE
jgi:hypothetical protein